MKQQILDYVNSSNFKNLLGKPVHILQSIEYGLLQVKRSPDLKNHKGGLYFLYDPNIHGQYKKEVIWYIGLSGWTKSESMRDRNIKHRRHALQLKSKSGNNQNWKDFNDWLKDKGHDAEGGLFDNNCKLLWIEVDQQISKDELKLLERNCICNLNPIVNDKFDWNSANQL
jgi:hypothetical protein